MFSPRLQENGGVNAIKEKIFFLANFQRGEKYEKYRSKEGKG
jgi:hypothetical protein